MPDSPSDIPVLKLNTPIEPPGAHQPAVDASSHKLYQEVNPALVQVATGNGEYGSGYFIDNKGDIATDAHVVYGSKQQFVILPNGKQYKAEITKLDTAHDVAIMHVENYNNPNQPYLNLADSNSVRANAPTYGFGYPDAYRPAYISPGAYGSQFTEASLIDEMDQVPQTNVALSQMSGDTLRNAETELKRPIMQANVHIEPGNSGGPLVNSDGQVIGQVDFKPDKSTSTSYAIPSDTVAGVLNNPSPYKLNYGWEPSPLMQSYEQTWKSNPVLGTAETALAAGGAYLGARALAARPGLNVVGLGYSAVDGINNIKLITGGDSEDRLKGGLGLTADGLVAAGSIAALAKAPPTYALAAIGLGVGLRVASSFIPNDLVLKSVKPADGSNSPVYASDRLVPGTTYNNSDSHSSH